MREFPGDIVDFYLVFDELHDELLGLGLQGPDPVHSAVRLNEKGFLEVDLLEGEGFVGAVDNDVGGRGLQDVAVNLGGGIQAVQSVVNAEVVYLIFLEHADLVVAQLADGELMAAVRPIGVKPEIEILALVQKHILGL